MCELTTSDCTAHCPRTIQPSQILETDTHTHTHTHTHTKNTSLPHCHTHARQPEMCGRLAGVKSNSNERSGKEKDSKRRVERSRRGDAGDLVSSSNPFYASAANQSQHPLAQLSF